MRRSLPGSVLMIIAMLVSLALAVPMQVSAEDADAPEDQITEDADLATDDESTIEDGDTGTDDEATGDESGDQTGSDDAPDDTGEDAAAGDELEVPPVDVDLGYVAPGETSAVYDASRGVTGGTPPYTYSVSVQGERGIVSVDAATGAMTYTANVDAAPGFDGFRLQVCDSAVPVQACGELSLHILITGDSDFEVSPIDIDLGEVAPGETTATYDAHNGVAGGTPPYAFSVGVYPLYGTVSVDATTGLVAYTANVDAAPGYDDFTVGICDSAATPACDQLYFHVMITDGSGDDTPTPTATATPEPTGTATPDPEPTKTDRQHDEGKKDTDKDETVTTLPATGHGPGATGSSAVLLGVATVLAAMAALSMRIGRVIGNG